MINFNFKIVIQIRLLGFQSVMGGQGKQFLQNKTTIYFNCMISGIKCVVVILFLNKCLSVITYKVLYVVIKKVKSNIMYLSMGLIFQLTKSNFEK